MCLNAQVSYASILCHQVYRSQQIGQSVCEEIAYNENYNMPAQQKKVKVKVCKGLIHTLSYLERFY